MDMSYFNYCQGLTMTSRKFDRLFGGPPRQPESPLTQREMDLAASVQAVTEEIMLRMARHVHEQTGLTKLCLAGGVALNCVANGRILREGPFTTSGFSPPPATRAGRWARPCSSGTNCWETPRGEPAGLPAGLAARAALLGATRFAASSTPREPATAGSTTKSSFATTSPI